jgi:hypothetical protein
MLHFSQMVVSWGSHIMRKEFFSLMRNVNKVSVKMPNQNLKTQSKQILRNRSECSFHNGFGTFF